MQLIHSRRHEPFDNLWHGKEEIERNALPQ